MRKLLLFITHFILLAGVTSAQNVNDTKYSGDGGSLSVGYDAILTDQVDSKWSLSVDYRNKKYFANSLYAGFGLGLYFPHTKTQNKDYDFEVKTSQTHFTLPVFLGIGNETGKYTFDTGPYLDWGIAGKTTVKQGDETEITRMKDQEGIKRISLGWQFMLRLGTIHCGVRLPFSQESSLKPSPMITIGMTF